MRWVWPYSRRVRISLNKQHLVPNTCAQAQRINGVDPQLQSPCRRYLAIEKQSRSKFPALRNLSARPRLHPPEDRVIAKHGKSSLNAAGYPQAAEHLDDWKDAGALESRDVPKPTKVGGRIQTARDANITKLAKATGFVKNTEPGSAPPDLVGFAGRQKVADYPNVSDSEIIAREDSTIQPIRRTVKTTRSKLPDESLATSSSSPTGVIIDGQGQLQIKSTAEALKERPTALVVSSVSGNMLQSDFTRLLAHTSDQETRSIGSMRAIRGRDVDFNRLPYWILLFDSPYNAASFQHRLHWYHANSILNLPVNSYTAATTEKREITPPEGYIDPLSGEDTWKRLREFSVLLPTQEFNVTALLEPFPDTIRTHLENDRLWRMHASWPLRIWVDEYDLSAALVERFLSEDGAERGRRWKLLKGVERIEPMVYTAFNSKGDPLDGDGNQISKEDAAFLSATDQKNWVIRFVTKQEALLFWRTWHRRSFPESLSQLPGEKGLLHVDPLW